MNTVEVRVVGVPEHVEETLSRLATHLDVTRISRPYACRRDPDSVRLYVRVEFPEVIRS